MAEKKLNKLVEKIGVFYKMTSCWEIRFQILQLVFKKVKPHGTKYIYLPPTCESSRLGDKLKGCFKCPHCNHCHNVVQGKTFLDENVKNIYSIKHFINLQTSRVDQSDT